MSKTKTNPPGKWVFRNMELQFLNDDILAIYGKVYPLVTDGKQGWYWEARTLMSARAGDGDMCPRGYAPSKDAAMRIVEMILVETGTVEKGE